MRSAQDAVTALNTLQSNFAIVDAIRKSGKGMNKKAIPEMIEWCRKGGYEVRRPRPDGPFMPLLVLTLRP